MALNETQRAQLDGIVSKMVANGEPDANIQFVVQDFKSKYDAGLGGGKGLAEKATETFINTQPLAGAYNAITKNNIGQQLSNEIFNSSENILPALIQGTAQTALLGQGNKILQPLFDENLDARTQQFKEAAPNIFKLGQGAGLMVGLPNILGRGAASVVGKGAQALGVGPKLASLGESIAEGAIGGVSGELGINPEVTPQDLQAALTTGALGGGAVNILGQGIKGAGNILGSIGLGRKGVGKVINESLPISNSLEKLEESIRQKISSLGQEKQALLSGLGDDLVPLPQGQSLRFSGQKNPMTLNDIKKITSIYRRGQDKATEGFLTNITQKLEDGKKLSAIEADKFKTILGDLSYSAASGNLKSGVLPEVLDDWRGELNQNLLASLPKGAANKVRVMNSQMEALFDPKRMVGKAQEKAPRAEIGTIIRDTLGQPAVFQTLHRLGSGTASPTAARIGGYLTQNLMAETKQTE